MSGFEQEKQAVFLVDKANFAVEIGFFGEKFNEVKREMGVFTAKSAHRNKSNVMSWICLRFCESV